MQPIYVGHQCLPFLCTSVSKCKDIIVYGCIERAGNHFIPPSPDVIILRVSSPDVVVFLLDMTTYNPIKNVVVGVND